MAYLGVLLGFVAWQVGYGFFFASFAALLAVAVMIHRERSKS